MLSSLKAMFVVLAIAAAVFHLAKPLALQFMSREDFSRRRLVWIVLTALFFVCPNLWIYALGAVPLLIWANRRDSNPVALYLFLLHVVTPVGVMIPIIGNNGLFALDNYKLLAFCVLLPTAMRYRRSRVTPIQGRFGSMDFLLLAYGVLEVALYTCPDLPYHSYIPDSPSNALRRGFLFLLDDYLLYYTISRTCESRQNIVEAAATFCLASIAMASIAIFEHARSWLLYVDVASRWGNDAHIAMYLMRGGGLRAETSAGHSIALGFLLAVAFGFWLYFKSLVQRRIHRIAGTLLLLCGLYATTSRGGWLGAATVYFTFLATGQQAATRLVKGTVLALAFGGLIVISPIGDQVLDMLPKSGQPADMYRHLLAERGWQVVMAHPLFGDRFPWPEMEDLRQGEGIIDIVNTYLGVALNYGLVGLSCFLSFILIGALRVYVRAKEHARSDPDLALFGTSLVACIAGILIMIRSDSFIFGCEKMFYILAGFAAAYASLTSSPQRQPAGAMGARTTLQD
jgi:hypothetical protein